MNGNDLTGSRACKMGGFCLYHLPVGEIERQDFCWKCGKAKEKALGKVSRDALAISDGSLSYLINETSYAIIEVVQREFFFFCRKHEGEFENWIAAWHAFAGTTEEAPKEYDRVKGEGAPQYTFFTAPDQQLALL